MLQKIKHIAFIALITATLTPSAWAQVGVGIKASTLGAGIDLVTAVPTAGGNAVNVRLNGNYFSYNRTDTLSDIRADTGLRFKSVGLLADWYPIQGSFHLSGGAYYNGNEIKVAGKPTAGGTYSFNGQTYTATEVGNLAGNADLGHKFAPYIGIGWGNAISPNKRVTVFAELGVLFTGSAKLALSSTGGSLSNDPTFKQNLDQERKKAQDDINVIAVYPVAAFGVAWRF